MLKKTGLKYYSCTNCQHQVVLSYILNNSDKLCPVCNQIELRLFIRSIYFHHGESNER
ncbi:hypothetical protein YerA41_030 [Yersinia phage YerA41]|nr:hypothetical protein YerA41_030 [Yersinia phage YerA41]